MSDNKGDSSTAKKLQQQPQQQSPSPNKDHLLVQDSSSHQQQPPQPLVVAGAPFISPTFDQQQQFEVLTTKRPRYGTATGHQWKLLPSPTSTSSSQPPQQIKLQQTSPMLVVMPSDSSTPSPTTNQPNKSILQAASSSDTASSPSHSPLSISQATSTKPQQQQQQQLRKGKYVSPIWKPNEMLMLAKAWRIQYQGTNGGSRAESELRATKTRADKDREVAEYLNSHGINRDAKTAGTKWDNMLGEFRKVYEWERGGEREALGTGGKSYFRLSPYERKFHRLPASFDEEVFEELAQFMSSRMRTSSQSGTGRTTTIGDQDTITRSSSGLGFIKALPPPPLRDDDLPLSARTKQLAMSTGAEPFLQSISSRGISGSSISLSPFEASLDIATNPISSSSLSRDQLTRIGKIRMTWEESVSLWAESGEIHRGRVKLGSNNNFLNADEIVFFDESMVACTLEGFEDGPFTGFSVDRFVPGQQVKVFGRRKSTFSSSSAPSSSTALIPGFADRDRSHLPLTEHPISFRSDFQDPTEYYVGCLRSSPPSTLPTLLELSWHLQEPPLEESRLPLRKDVYRDLPQGKELFFTTSAQPLDCRAFTYDILGPIIRPGPCISGATSTSRDSFIALWDDCINRIVSRFCVPEMIIVRKSSPTSSSPEDLMDQWPNVAGFVRNFCLWRGEEADQLRHGHIDPSNAIVEKLLWTYMDLPYILGYYAVGYMVTFCALSLSQDRILRTDLYSLDLSVSSERLKALIPCWRIACLLPLLADKCSNMASIDGGSGVGNKGSFFLYSDFERLDLENGNIVEMTPNTVTKFFSSKRKWSSVKEIYDVLELRIPHSEYLIRCCEKELALFFKPRGCKVKPSNVDELVECLKYVTKALVALHDMSFMHRDLTWDKVLKSVDKDNEWFVCGFDEAAGVPQMYPSRAASGRHAPEMGRGLHGVKVDVWGIGWLVKTCGLVNVPKLLRELQNRCLEQNPEMRPTAADCYHHLLQLSAAAGGGY